MTRNSSHNPVSSRAKPHPKRLYTFAITAIATFLLFLLLWQVPVSGYLSETTLSINGGSNGQPMPSVTDVRKAAQDEELITDVIRQVTKRERINIPAQRANLFFTPLEEESSAESLHFKLGFRGASPQQSMAIANEIARRLKTSLAQSNVDEDVQAELLEISQQEVDEAIRLNGTTQAEMHTFLSQHLELLERQLPTTPTKVDAATSSTDISEEADAADDPELAKLKRELANLNEEHIRLGMIRTDKHPAMLNLARQMAALQAQINSYAASVPLPAIDESNDEATTGDTEGSADAVALASFSQEYGLLNERVLAVQRRLAASMESLAEIRKQQDAAQPFHVTIVKPASSAKRMGGSPPPGRVILGGLVGVVLGGGVAWMVTAPARGNVLATDNDVKQQVSVPVFATISTGESNVSQATDRSLGWNRIANRVATTCEVTLIAILLLIIVVALFDSPLASEFIDDPFGALTESIRRIVP